MRVDMLPTEYGRLPMKERLASITHVRWNHCCGVVDQTNHVPLTQIASQACFFVVKGSSHVRASREDPFTREIQQIDQVGGRKVMKGEIEQISDSEHR
jgi:hypothetical protein